MWLLACFMESHFSLFEQKLQYEFTDYSKFLPEHWLHLDTCLYRKPKNKHYHINHTAKANKEVSENGSLQYRILLLLGDYGGA